MEEYTAIKMKWLVLQAYTINKCLRFVLYLDLLQSFFDHRKNIYTRDVCVCISVLLIIPSVSAIKDYFLINYFFIIFRNLRTDARSELLQNCRV